MDTKNKTKAKKRSRLGKAWDRLMRTAERKIGPVLVIPAVQRALGLIALVTGLAIIVLGLGPIGLTLVLLGGAFLLAYWSQTQ